MIAVCIILASGLVLALGLSTFLAVVAFTAWNKAADSVRAYERKEAELDALRTANANASIEVAVAAEKKQEQRGDALEKEVVDVEKHADPAAGIDRLRDAGADPSRSGG